ncbi:MucR family transcriptional regulator [Ensifer sp. IC3342]|nr:MucR family transcriptional regulator [Ensifer sp. BRP08]MCA1450799.1 MucR family transcriptional regulator [Ensifer sp. IC3342]
MLRRRSLTESRSEIKERKLELTSRIVSAYLSRNVIPAGELPHLIQQTYASLDGRSRSAEAEPSAEEQRPAVPIKKSVTDDFIICLEDGKKFKSLRRHLTAKYGLTPQQYREKWKLPADYPMTAPNYARQRSELARATGLGKRAATSALAPEAAPPARKKIGLKF